MTSLKNGVQHQSGHCSEYSFLKICGAVLVLSLSLLVGPMAIGAEPNAQAIFSNGAKLLKQKKYAEATKAFDSGLRVDPNNALAHFYDGIAYAYLDKPVEAQRHLYMSLALQPEGVHSNQAWLIISELRRSAAVPSKKP